jgi:putative endonuclease
MVLQRTGVLRSAGMPGIRQLLGARGERAAARYLRRRGYAIVRRNWRGRAGEIDLVALHGGVLVFVEVKTRAQDRFGGPIEAIGGEKRRRIARLAAEFLRAHRLEERSVRFDVVSVRPKRWGWEIELVQDAFAAELPFSF